MSRVIYALLEGEDDERFFNRIVRAELAKKHSRIKVYKYAQITRINREKFVDWLKKSGTAYIFFSDMDRMTCYTKKKEQVKSKVVKNVDITRIAVVKAEIESWYLAGLDRRNAASLEILHSNNTENITKEDFAKVHKKYTSKIDFMTVILEKFSWNVAKTQNESFRYFCDKFL